MKQCRNNNLLRNTALYDEAMRRYKEISERQLVAERELQKTPPGIIHVVKSGTRIQFYLRATEAVKGSQSSLNKFFEFLQVLLPLM